MNQERKRQILRFVEARGFYIILALCVAAIGISGYVLFFMGSEPAEIPVVLQEPQQSQTPVVRPDPMEDTPATQPETPSQPTVEPAEPEPQPVMRPEAAARTAPVSGKVMRPFSGYDLVYDQTMGDWRTHNGADYSAAQGDPVVAVCDGVVGAVWVDELRGSCVRLDCADGVYVTYCGLAANQTVTPGMKLTAGQQIGKVGNGMLTESREESHLHIELVQNGTYLDPEKFLR